jgi:hypothetical protein
LLLVEPGCALYGFGTINTDVDLDGTADLWADDGTLTISPGNAILNVDQLGTADDDGTLNVETRFWNTNVANVVVLNGGELTGNVITNDGVNGIKGYGLVSVPVINNSRIDAVGGTLIVDASGSFWDGLARTGQLNATGGDLEIHDDANYSFAGRVRADDGRTVFANGFNLLFEPASTLELTQGTYRTFVESADDVGEFGGTVIVHPGGPSRLRMSGRAWFRGASTTTLHADLVLDTARTFIDVGAEFGGSGALINVPQSILLIQDGVDLGVSIVNDGIVRFGLSFIAALTAQVSAVDFEQTEQGTIQIELQGTGPDEFDRLDLTGAASLDGGLGISTLNGYVPALGDAFDFLSAANGVVGTFATVQQPNAMPTGLIFDLIYSPTLVRLVVMPELLGDYNLNGVVDAADYAAWRDTLGAAETAFSGADGNGDGTIDAGDYDVWRAHFGQSAGSGVGAHASPVPEPMSALLLCYGLSIGAIFRLRKSRRIKVALPASRRWGVPGMSRLFFGLCRGLSAVLFFWHRQKNSWVSFSSGRAPRL